MRFSRSFGIADSFSAAIHLPRTFLTTTSGMTKFASDLANDAPGPGIQAHHQRAHRAHAGVVGVQDALQLREIARREERQVLGDDRAAPRRGRASISGSAFNCSARHSEASRAPMPAGSKLCR